MKLVQVIVLIFLCIILLYTIIFIIYKSGYSPKNVKSEKNVQSTINCSLTPTPCEELGKPCIECNNSDSPGLFSCQQVPGNQYDSQGNLIKKGGITIIDPNRDNLSITIPEGKYCLPASVESSVCNPYTSDPVLTKVSDSLYKWDCYCKKPEWISSGGIGSDCNVPVMCGADRNKNNKLLYCKSGGSYSIDPDTGKGICNDSSQPIEWNSNSSVEMENIFCSCAPGSYFYENKQLGIKSCIPNPCGDTPPEYDSAGNMFCKCKMGEISCSTLPDDKKSECAIGCMPDPCIAKFVSDDCKKNPDDPACKNYYDPGQSKCICGDKYTLINDSNYITNGYCIPKNSACTPDIVQNCSGKRGGKCISCINPGNNTADYSSSHCVNCKVRNGFLTKAPLPVDSKGNLTQSTINSYCKAKPVNDCKPCELTFTKCSTDSECCTGRCHEGTCYPTNGFGWGGSDRDKNCYKATNGERGVSNIYNIRGNWDADNPLYMGFCESTKCDPMVDWNCVPDNIKGKSQFDYNCPGVS
jgi:hypothetical protein